MDIIKARAFLNEVLGHLIVLAMAAVAAYAASHGLHLHIPAFPAGITATALYAAARLAIRGLAKAFHSGKAEAILLADLKRFGPQILQDVITEAEKSA